jgi:predicted Zn-dependent peptidase
MSTTIEPRTITVPRVAVEQFTLENGLRVILSQDKAVPVVSVAVYYDVGSRNEPVGRTGFAHLFEHMMFQGSENVPKAAHFQRISNAGGTMNGTTSTERTNYYETLPANQLPLALWLESDRMRSLKVTQENLDNQRDAVKEEKRLRYDNQPYINAFLRISELIYQNPHNAHSTIGSMEDLDDATVEDVREFFRVYYAPNNAVLSIVGDFEHDEARELVEKFFGSIPSQPAPPAVDVSEPEEIAQRADVYHDRFAPSPAFMLAGKLLRGALRIPSRCRSQAICSRAAKVRGFTRNSSRKMNRCSRFKAATPSVADRHPSTSSPCSNTAKTPNKFARKS